MIRRKIIKNLAAVVYTLAITFAIGKWSIHAAYIERGYKAVGGEYCLIFMACWMAWKTINYLLKTLEGFKHGRNCKKGRSRGTSRMHGNR